ncbi:SDR family oxidoreductase [Streptomyces sp. NPDC051976]|uniref:SDR family NAD(P)-dependent oxidoreductase n=1 Tax=Streptomyces sp. NPDC051976 TaxID=3154947 RepID=UPI00343FB174
MSTHGTSSSGTAGTAGTGFTGGLEGKTAVIYGAGGVLGGGIAREFAREGARVFLAGRTPATLEAVAADIRAAGGQAGTDVVDALDEDAVQNHLDKVVATAGRVDVSLNLIKRGDVQGVPLVDMTADDLLRAVTNGLRSNFLTARAAARQMARQGSGVILHLNSASGDGAFPGMGSTGPADAATESFMRYLAAETGPQGVRVCGIWTAGVAETFETNKLTEVNANATDPQAALDMIASMSAMRRTPRLADVAAVAAFLASDRASGITGTMTNVTAGLVLR